MGYSSIEPDVMADMISSLSTAANTLQDTGGLKADCDYWGVGAPFVQITAIGAWVEAELPMLRRRLSLAQALETQAGTNAFVRIVEPPAMTAEEAAQLGRELAARLAAYNRTDQAGAELLHEIAQELQRYENDPDVMSAFFGQLGPQYTQTIPQLMSASGSDTGAQDLEIYSRALGVAMNDVDPPADFTQVTSAFTNPGDNGGTVPVASWGRLAMVQHGDFPPEWLTQVVRINALDAFAEDPNRDFRGGSVFATQATGLPEDVLALAFSALRNNPEAARSALQTMGEPDHRIPMTELVDRVYDYASAVGTGDSVADAFGLAIESGAGVHDERAGDHSTAASRFAFDFIVASADHPDPPWMLKDSLSAVATSYTHELAVGSSLVTRESSAFGYSGERIPGLNPSFTLSAEDVYGFVHGFADDDQFTAPFDAAMGEVYMNALIAAGRVDERAIANGEQDPENFEKVSELFGGLAGLEYEAKEQVRGDMDEADERMAGILKDIVIFPLNFVPADEWIVTGVRLGADGAKFLWELAQYGADKGLGSALEVDPADTRVGQIENEEHVRVLSHHYAVAQALLDAGYPVTPMPESVGSNGQLKPFDEIDPAAFQTWIRSNDGPASFLSKMEQGTLIFLGGSKLGEEVAEEYEQNR